MADDKVVNHFRELRVYRMAFTIASTIFELSKSWPNAERYSLIDQIRRSSRSVCGSIAEGWRKRRYPAHFVSKMSDADSEAAETQAWLDFAKKCGYLDEENFLGLNHQLEKISGGLVKMMAEPEKWCFSTTTVREEAVGYELND